jgi:TATA-box binding protein (TBP) (component of TFIID and TFIIIB)
MSLTAEINNYKVSFRFPKNLLSDLEDLSDRILIGAVEETTLNWHRQLGVAVVRSCGFVYIVNFSGFVNITGVNSREGVEASIANFLQKVSPLPPGRTLPPYDVDNISASGHLGHRLSLLAVAEAAEGCSDGGPQCTVSYRKNVFSAVWLRFRALGTVGLFGSGSFTIVGAQRESALPDLCQRILAIVLRSRQPP